MSTAQSISPPIPAELTPGMRLLITSAIALAVTAGVSLFVFTTQTDQLFAWTIKSPLTAAFLGAAYLGDIPLLLAARRERFWAHAKVCAWGIVLFTAFSLVATLLHLDKFHLSGAFGTAQAAGWAWMAIYITLPIVALWQITQQNRVPGGDPPVETPMPSWLRNGHGAVAVLAAALGATLLLAPTLAPTLNVWPWALTPLTSRAISARILALAGMEWLTARRGDARSARVGNGSLIARGALALVAVARYPAEIDLASPAGMAFVAICALAVVAGAYGWYQGRGIKRG